MRRLVGTVLAVVALSTAASCSSDALNDAGPSPQTATTVAEATGVEGTTVTIQNFAFSPPALRAAAGEEITVKNADGVVHTLTAEDRSFSTGTLDPSATATVKPPRAGTFAYFCEIHQYMKGQITVS